MQESVTFGQENSHMQFSNSQGREQIVITPKLDEPEREVLENSVGDKIIINEAESGSTQNPILVNNDDVLTPEERARIENLEFEEEVTNMNRETSQ